MQPVGQTGDHTHHKPQSAVGFVPDQKDAGIWRKWDGTRKWVVAQDKATWDHDFREAEEWAELQAPATSEDVLARLRTRLGNLG